MAPDEQLRFGTALAHGVPGVSLELGCTNGDVLTVAHGRLGAALDPCHLRAAVLAPCVPGVPRLADVVRSVEVGSGLVHLGGGLYARGHPAGGERCFVTTLPHRHVEPLLAACPLPGARDHVEAALRVDPELGAVLVRITPLHGRRGGRGGLGDALDEVAAWALTACLVDELTVAGRRPAHRGDRRGR